MRISKKTLTSLAILVGIVVLATTVVVGAVSDTPYAQLKTAVRTTLTEASKTSGNSTAVTTIVLKDNGTVLYRSTESQKSAAGAYEQAQTTQLGTAEPRISYSFSNGRMNIYYDQTTDTYFVNKYSNVGVMPDASGVTNYGSNDTAVLKNWTDIEKIVDAFVGNLKDYVTVTENADGGKTFAGSLNDAQIPALANALASFATKQYLQSTTYTTGTAPIAYDSAGNVSKDPDANSRISAEAPYGLPSLTGDLYIKSVSATATTLPNGVLTDVQASVVLSGTDEDGVVHDLALDLHVAISDMGTTVVSEPDLTGKKVQISESTDPYTENKLTAAFVGTYRNDVVAMVDGVFTKIGTRTIVVESVTDETVTGRYFETYVDGTTHAAPLSFEFSVPNGGYYSINVSYAGRDGITVNSSINFDVMSGTANFYDASSKEAGFGNGVFARVFD